MVINIYNRLGVVEQADADEVIVLDHEKRDKGRLKAQAESGTEVRIFLERGKALKPGELLQSECGKTVRVEAAVEPVMAAECDDWLTFSRACYHLGNRHVKIQVLEKRLLITPDHVLQEMLEQLGLTVTLTEAPFVPESGAYAKGHSHGHGHSHNHNHGHHHAH